MASRNLPFRGETAVLDKPDNGHFLGLIELLSKYDNILHEHLQKIREQRERGKRLQAHYRSPESQNEFIELCSTRVLNTILKERQDSAYFSIICDATPDVSNLEQNVLLIRYVHQSPTEGWKIKERFLKFRDKRRDSIND